MVTNRKDFIFNLTLKLWTFIVLHFAKQTFRNKHQKSNKYFCIEKKHSINAAIFLKIQDKNH